MYACIKMWNIVSAILAKESETIDSDTFPAIVKMIKRIIKIKPKVN
jgi:hypothetical protein